MGVSGAMAAALDRGGSGRGKQEICANYVDINYAHASYLTYATVISSEHASSVRRATATYQWNDSTTSISLHVRSRVGWRLDMPYLQQEEIDMDTATATPTPAFICHLIDLLTPSLEAMALP